MILVSKMTILQIILEITTQHKQAAFMKLYAYRNYSNDARIFSVTSLESLRMEFGFQESYE